MYLPLLDHVLLPKTVTRHIIPHTLPYKHTRSLPGKMGLVILRRFSPYFHCSGSLPLVHFLLYNVCNATTIVPSFIFINSAIRHHCLDAFNFFLHLILISFLAERSTRMREIGVRSSVATDLSRKNR